MAGSASEPTRYCRAARTPLHFSKSTFFFSSIPPQQLRFVNHSSQITTGFLPEQRFFWHCTAENKVKSTSEREEAPAAPPPLPQKGSHHSPLPGTEAPPGFVAPRSREGRTVIPLRLGLPVLSPCLALPWGGGPGRGWGTRGWLASRGSC